MFNNISGKIKGIAYIMIVIAILGGIWFVVSWWNYGSIIDEFGADGYTTLKTKAYMELALSLFISGIMSSFLIYGFGELIERSQSIVSA